MRVFPLQTRFTEALLEPRNYENYSLRPLLDRLGTFVHDVFDHSSSAKASFWPELEDVFTNIDLAANSGHHLGSNFPPSKLRTIRRLLLARTMSMLHERFCAAEIRKDDEWIKLESFIRELDVHRSAFISMNWDTAIERRVVSLKDVERFDYQCDAIRARFPNKGKVIARCDALAVGAKLPIVKMHGSVNWLYCDNCRRLYWFRPEHSPIVALQLITPSEARELGLAENGEFGKWRCMRCTSVPLTTRIATFSFLKALNFPMFEKSWLAAELLLRGAKKWIFIGYSLPAADYEFKHLLKRVQLSRKPPEFVVITGGSPEQTNRTYGRSF